MKPEKLLSPTPTRDEIQELAVKTAYHYDRVLFNFSVGLGKTLIGGKIGDKRKVLCICAKLVHIDNWKEDLNKHNIDYSNWTFTVINSLNKYQGQIFDVVVFDEAHTITENYKKDLLEVGYNQLICLTGSLSFDKYRLLKNLVSYHWKIDYSQAESWGIVPPIEFVCIGINLDNTNRYIPYKRFKKTFMMTEKECLEAIEKDMAFWQEKYKTEKKEFQRLNMLRKGLERKKLFQKAKRSTIKELFNYFKSTHRILVFSDSIEESNTYPFSINSAKSDAVNSALIESFNEGDINYLANVSCLTMGMNLNNVEITLMGTFDSNDVFLIQAAGRSRLSKAPVIYIPYVSGTKEVTDLQKFFNKHNFYATWQ